MNPRKNQILKEIWFFNEKQYIDFIEAIENNDIDKILKIVFDIQMRKGFQRI
jgi:hypothetical protein